MNIRSIVCRLFVGKYSDAAVNRMTALLAMHLHFAPMQSQTYMYQIAQ
jgi:hypothetical protein